MSQKNGFVLKVERGHPSLVMAEKETPTGLYFLSNLDQNMIRLNPTTSTESHHDDLGGRLQLLTSLEENKGMIVSTVYCFKPKGNDGSAAQVLKTALSKVLVQYYPFTGRLDVSHEGKLIVDCRGQGAIFVEAHAEGCKMVDMVRELKNCSSKLLDDVILGQLVYAFPQAKTILDIPPLMVQLTRFSCGGFVLGLSMNHALCDGVGSAMLNRAWGEVARGLLLSLNAPQTSPPPFHDRTILRSRDPPLIDPRYRNFMEMLEKDDDTRLTTSCSWDDQSAVMKSFFLDSETLKSLRSKALEEDEERLLGSKCTTFEALTAFVWRARTSALSGYNSNYPNHKSKLVFPVDGRPRFNPPLPEGYFGNAVTLTGCACPAGDLVSRPLCFAAAEIRRAIDMVDDGFMRSVIDYYQVMRTRPVLRSILLVTAWSRLSMLENDFGWGVPVYSGPVGLPSKEVMMFLPGDNGSINLLLQLPESAMKAFEGIMDDMLDYCNNSCCLITKIGGGDSSSSTQSKL